MIIDYLYEFHENPKGIEEYKINTLKNFYYPRVNKILIIKRDNFQIGVNNNFNIIFFRDRTNKHNELILNIHNNQSVFNFRKQVSYSFNRIKSDNFDNKSSTKDIEESIDYFNRESYKRCNLFKCNIL